MWEKVVGVNLNGCFYATKYVLPGMVARGWGRIINIASVHGLVASPHKAAYVAAKQALIEEKQPSGECAQPEHLAALVALLCSEAGQQITGGTYTVDGGWTAQ
jgi:3-hydroxybutyrate dehydrogenase